MGYKQLYYRAKQKYQIGRINRKSDKQYAKTIYLRELQKQRRKKAYYNAKKKARQKVYRKKPNFKKMFNLKI